jgi:signal transduction histidine kinase
MMTLVSFEDITNELDRKELDSWQRLIRVLTHEIMNSVSPVISLTSVIAGYFKDKKDGSPVTPEKIDQHVIYKTLSGLNTIEETGKGLLDFVDKYRSLNLLPEPKPVRFTIDKLFSKCRQLMESFVSERIEIITRVDPEDLSLTADQSQVEQVLINLMKNSIEAIGNMDNGRISLSASYAGSAVIIQVGDNGIGIPESIAKDIFVPFYTTKENGSGIGLSLSRQIMYNHNGTISANSTPGAGSVFSLRFPTRNH